MKRRVFWILFLSSLSFGAMAIAARLASRTLPAAQIAWVRFSLMLVPVLFVPKLWKRATEFERWDLLLYRGVFGGIAVLLYFLAIEHTSAGVATLLNYSSPIWSVLFAALLLGEPVNWRLVPAALVSFLGIVLVVQGYHPVGDWHFGVWEGVGFASAIVSGAAVASIRAARRTENSWAIYASLGTCGVLVTLPFALQRWRSPSGVEWLLLLAVGGASIAAQLLMTYAYRWVTNLEAGAMSQIAVVVAMGLGAWLLGESVRPVAVLGSALTMGGVLAVVWLQTSRGGALVSPPQDKPSS
jgi:drug/metabolite transporter (DMT)-like permease